MAASSLIHQPIYPNYNVEEKNESHFNLYSKSTKSICPICFRTIEARVFEDQGKIFIEKECVMHRYFRDVYWSDASLFKQQLRYAVDGDPIENPNTKSKNDCPRDCGLCEEHNTHTMLANIDITNRCNQNCPICFANAKAAGITYEPTLEQIIDMLAMLRNQKPNPVWAVQFSGGEPTVHPKIFDIISMAKEFGFRYVIIATNGLKIAEDLNFAKQLKKSGLNIAYLQFDGVSSEPYIQARGFDALPVKLKAVENLREAGLPTTLVPTIVKGLNDDQLGAIIEYGFKNLDTVKSVNFQPVSFTGRINKNDLEKKRITISDIMKLVEKQTEGRILRSDWLPISAFAILEMMMEKISKARRSVAATHVHCGLGVYIFEKNRSYIPLNRFVDLEKIRNILLNEFKKDRLFLTDLRRNTSLIYKISKTINKKEAPEYFDFKELLMIALLHQFNEIPTSLKKKGIFIGCMHFMDPYNFDLDRVERCCIHYATPDQRIIPFCSYNILHRSVVESKFSVII